MDCRTVVVMLLIAHAAWVPAESATLRSKAVNATIGMMQEQIQSALNHLNTHGLLYNDSCPPVLNTTELVGPGQNLTAHHLFFFRCYLDKANITELSTHLQLISQYALDLEQKKGGQTVQQNCSLPAQEERERYVYVKCLLDLLKKQLRYA